MGLTCRTTGYVPSDDLWERIQADRDLADVKLVVEWEAIETYDWTVFTELGRLATG